MGTRFLLAGTVLFGAVLALRGRAVFRLSRAQIAGAAMCGLLLLVGGTDWSPWRSRMSIRASPRC